MSLIEKSISVNYVFADGVATERAKGGMVQLHLTLSYDCPACASLCTGFTCMLLLIYSARGALYVQNEPIAVELS